MEIKEIKKTIIVEFTQDDIAQIIDTLGEVLRWFDGQSPSAMGETFTNMVFKLNKVDIMINKIRTNMLYSKG